MLIIDCEIVCGVLKKGEHTVDGIKYAKNWEDYETMGISVVGMYSYKEKALITVFSTQSWNDDCIKTVQKYIDGHDLIVGFNNIAFDNPLLEAHGVKIPREKVYDILVEIKRAANAGKYAKGYNLGNIAKMNNCCLKSGSGAEAPIMWQRGLYEAVVDYCKQDIMVTKDVLDAIIAGTLVNPINNRILSVMKPIDEDEDEDTAN